MESQVATYSDDRFSDVYLKFTHLYSQTQVRETAQQVRIPEKVIRCIWNDQLIKTDELKTTDGEKIDILFPGYWNFGSGPDFTRIVIKVNGKTYEGDAEIHVYSKDWKAHKHSENPEYDNVVLHVFMWKSAVKNRARKPKVAANPARLPGAHIFELELKTYLEKGILELTDTLDFDHYPIINKFNYGLCHEPLARLPKAKLIHLLNLAGDARILVKMERFHDRVIINGYEQTFYEGLAEALGYPSNKKQFQTLAERLPLETLKKLLPATIKKKDRALHIQAMLLGVSGLIDFKTPAPEGLPTADRKYFKRIETLWRTYKPRIAGPLMLGESWNFGQIRPANYPYRRIAGLSHLLVRHWPNGVFSDFMEYFNSICSATGEKDDAAKTLQRAYQFLRAEAAGDYWSTHYTPGGKELPSAQQLIGADRAREITINIMIPLGLIYARASKSKPMEKALKTLYQSGKGPPDNKMIRFMKHYILGDKTEMIKMLKTDKQHQGLMQVYQDYCTQNENNCLRCQFPEVVEQYFS